MYVKKHIDIGSVTGIDEAIAYLQDNLTKESMQKKVRELAKALAEEAKAVAEEEYAGCGIKVTIEEGETKDELVIKAAGEHIAFIEFGAGMTTDPLGSPVFAGEAERQEGIEVEEGTYSRANSGMYANLGYWEFGGKIYRYVIPHPGMEFARVYLSDSAGKRLREVFGVD